MIQPRARGFFTVLFDDNAIYFTTGTPKDFYKQIEKKRKDALCCVSTTMQMLRIAGT